MDYKDQISEIQRLIQRRTYFVGISGWSGIIAGTLALLGALYGYYLKKQFRSGSEDWDGLIVEIVVVAGIILVLSVSAAFLLSYRSAQKQNLSIWTHASKALILNAGLMLLIGGILAIIMLYKGYPFNILAPAITLTFYGISCFVAAYHTFSSVRYLGIGCILLGLIAFVFPSYSLPIWALGFGVFHIIYGVLHLKSQTP